MNAGVTTARLILLPVLMLAGCRSPSTDGDWMLIAAAWEPVAGR